MPTKTRDPLWVLQNIVEERRKYHRLSLRTAAARANLSEASWRQLAAGGVNSAGRWVARHPRRDQVLDMALAVDAFEDAAKAMGATDEEKADARRRVTVTDPAEEEIMSMRNLRPIEKMHLLAELQRLREATN